MKHSSFVASVVFTSIVLLTGCAKDPSIDASLFTIEEIDGVQYVYNHAPQLGYASGVELKLLGKIGKLESEEEDDILFDPVDAARLPNGDILVLEGRGCTVERYNKDYEFISSFGQPGQGPGDLMYPHLFRADENRIYVAGRRVSIFALDGNYEDGFNLPVMTRFRSSFGAQYRTSSLAILSGSRMVLPCYPTKSTDWGEHDLLSVYEKNGLVVSSFVAFKQYESPELTLNSNIVYMGADSNDNLYLAYAHQNNIAKYSPDGDMIFSTSRTLPYEIENVIKVEVFRSGNMEREFPWPSVSSVAKGIGVDHQNRIWVLTFLKQPNRSMTFDEGESLTDCYEFDVFDSNGILMFEVPFPDVRFNNFSIYDDRLYLIDTSDQSCVYEFKIVEQ